MMCGDLLDSKASFELFAAANALDVRSWDTAEMYPVPQAAKTQGRSEELLGEWLQGHRREEHNVMTKVSGPGGMEWLRGGPKQLDGYNITAAIDSSLHRLRTDYIDMLLLHWPDRCRLLTCCVIACCATAIARMHLAD
jgi:aryl-alcohol dehydrogenase-like predicted oxidoreductase